MHGIGIALLGIVLLILLPVVIPVVALSHWLYRKRLHAAAEAFACHCCGGILGHHAILRADAACLEHMRHLREQYPHAIFRRGSPPRRGSMPEAICAKCGAQYSFLKDKRTFVTARFDYLSSQPRG